MIWCTACCITDGAVHLAVCWIRTAPLRWLSLKRANKTSPIVWTVLLLGNMFPGTSLFIWLNIIHPVVCNDNFKTTILLRMTGGTNCSNIATKAVELLVEPASWITGLTEWLTEWLLEYVLNDCRFQPRCKLDLRSSDILRRVDWFGDVSKQPFGAIFKIKQSCLTLENGTDKLLRNVGNKLPIYVLPLLFYLLHGIEGVDESKYCIAVDMEGSGPDLPEGTILVCLWTYWVKPWRIICRPVRIWTMHLPCSNQKRHAWTI